jgi:hypothetical protein
MDSEAFFLLPYTWRAIPPVEFTHVAWRDEIDVDDS